ncbi:MAG: N-acetylmuramoyl-L-alanine amidase, partial [Mucinivorans sp.]
MPLRGATTEPKVPIVVIDAGHGGKDPGAVRGSIHEKTINLAVA